MSGQDFYFRCAGCYEPLDVSATVILDLAGAGYSVRDGAIVCPDCTAAHGGSTLARAKRDLWRQLAYAEAHGGIPFDRAHLAAASEVIRPNETARLWAVSPAPAGEFCKRAHLPPASAAYALYRDEIIGDPFFGFACSACAPAYIEFGSVKNWPAGRPRRRHRP